MEIEMLGILLLCIIIGAILGAGVVNILRRVSQ